MTFKKLKEQYLKNQAKRGYGHPSLEGGDLAVVKAIAELGPTLETAGLKVEFENYWISLRPANAAGKRLIDNGSIFEITSRVKDRFAEKTEYIVTFRYEASSECGWTRDRAPSAKGRKFNEENIVEFFGRLSGFRDLDASELARAEKEREEEEKAERKRKAQEAAKERAERKITRELATDLIRRVGLERRAHLGDVRPDRFEVKLADGTSAWFDVDDGVISPRRIELGENVNPVTALKAAGEVA